MKNYGVNDIQTLSFRDAVRTKLGMYLSADQQEAMQLGLREIIYNTRDEYEQGYGDKIIIEIDKIANKITVTDNARGIPCGIRQDGINSLTAACTMSHTGAKHEEGVYSGAVGINGIGLKVVCLTAENFTVDVFRDGKIYSQWFKEGIAHTEVEEKSQQKPYITGTIIKYIPSKEVYGNHKIDTDQVKDALQEISYFTKGFEFILKIFDGKTTEEYTYKSKNGLADALNSKHRIHNNFLHYETVMDDVKIEFALQWVKDNAQLKSFANNLEVRDGGAFMTGFKTSLTKAFNSQGKTNFSGDTIRKYLDGYVSVKVKVPQFSNQAKTALANPEARTSTSKAITQALGIFANQYREEFAAICEYLQKETKAEEAADRARNAVINAQAQIAMSKKDKIKAPGKLMDCEIHDENSSLYIVEGDSAKGSIGQARDYKNTAVLPLRGKIINALKNDEEKVLTNDIVMDLLKALGCGILEKYDIKKLNYGKICIFTDADVDGASIMCLVLTFFYKYIPQLLSDKKVYWAQAPLYKIKINDKYHYAYDDKEKDEILKGKGKYEITRCKGIGEMNAEDVRNTVLSDDISRFKRFTMDNIEEAIKMFEMLMGSDVTDRKEYIFNKVDFANLEE